MNLDGHSLKVSIDTTDLDQLEAQLDRILEKLERLQTLKSCLGVLPAESGAEPEHVYRAVYRSGKLIGEWTGSRPRVGAERLINGVTYYAEEINHETRTVVAVERWD